MELIKALIKDLEKKEMETKNDLETFSSVQGKEAKFPCSIETAAVKGL